LQILERENKPPKNNNHAKSLKKRVRKRPTKFSMQILGREKVQERTQKKNQLQWSGGRGLSQSDWSALLWSGQVSQGERGLLIS